MILKRNHHELTLRKMSMSTRLIATDSKMANRVVSRCEIDKFLYRQNDGNINPMIVVDIAKECRVRWYDHETEDKE